MKTVEELTAAVNAAETASDAMAELGYLKARLAGVKSRYLSFGVTLPADVLTLDVELDTAIATQKSK